MDDQDLIRADMQAQWYYGQAGEQLGPVSGLELNAKLRGKEVAPTVLVWRQGMAQWVPVVAVPALIQGVRIRPGQMMDPAPRRQLKIVRNAKQNCIAMFVVLMLWLVAISVQVHYAMSGKKGAGEPGCIGTAVVLGGIYAAIYLPLRWRTIRQLPSPYGTLGIIGGVGLIVVVFLSIIAVAAATALHVKF
jgi:hypothetical protein